MSPKQNTNNRVFCNVKNMERERLGLFGVECNATLPADWKHPQEPVHCEKGVFRHILSLSQIISFKEVLCEPVNTDLL